MKSICPRIIFLLLVLPSSAATTLCLHDAAYATTVFIDNLAGLGETDSIDWSTLGPQFPDEASPFTISTNEGSPGATLSAISAGLAVIGVVVLTLPHDNFVSLDPSDPPPVPEPSTLALLGSGLPVFVIAM